MEHDRLGGTSFLALLFLLLAIRCRGLWILCMHRSCIGRRLIHQFHKTTLRICNVCVDYGCFRILVNIGTSERRGKFCTSHEQPTKVNGFVCLELDNGTTLRMICFRSDERMIMTRLAILRCESCLERGKLLFALRSAKE